MPALQTYTQPLTFDTAAHLLRRCTFGPTQNDINSLVGLTVTQAMDILFQSDLSPSPPIDPQTGLDWVSPAPGPGSSEDKDLRIQFFAWWNDIMFRQPLRIQERMVWFYHTHFPTISSRINHSAALYHQVSFFRNYALGNYKSLARAMCIDNAMLIHLDGNLNEVGSPQENFAREFFELFTVGKGNQVGPEDYTTFTETDVKAATRVLTGWGTDFTFSTLDPLTGIPTGRVKANGAGQANKHDASAKQFSSAFANTLIQPGEMNGPLATIAGVHAELDSFVNMVFNSLHTARHFCRKLYRFFVYYKITPQVEQNIIEPLAQQLWSSNYEVSGVLRTLLQSNHFFDADDTITQNDVRGALIKAPIEITIGTLRTLEVVMPSMDPNNLNLYYQAFSKLPDTMNGQGLDFYEPYDVAGFDPYYQFPGYNRLWITPNYLAMRYKFGESLMTGFSDMNSNLLFKLDVVDFVQQRISNPANPDILLQELLILLFPVQLDQGRFDYFRNQVLLDTLSEVNWANEWNYFALGGNDTNVRIQLELLFKALIQCPEYQIM